MALYSSDQKCVTEGFCVDEVFSAGVAVAALEKAPWPEGFRCPRLLVMNAGWSMVGGASAIQYRSCRRVAILTASTIMEATKLLLSIWFLAFSFVCQAKPGISLRALVRHLPQAEVLRAWASIITPAVLWTATVLSNPKTGLSGAYHAFRFNTSAPSSTWGPSAFVSTGAFTWPASHGLINAACCGSLQRGEPLKLAKACI
jgi:hypothetical protein